MTETERFYTIEEIARATGMWYHHASFRIKKIRKKFPDFGRKLVPEGSTERPRWYFTEKEFTAFRACGGKGWANAVKEALGISDGVTEKLYTAEQMKEATGMTYHQTIAGILEIRKEFPNFGRKFAPDGSTDYRWYFTKEEFTAFRVCSGGRGKGWVNVFRRVLSFSDGETAFDISKREMLTAGEVCQSLGLDSLYSLHRLVKNYVELSLHTIGVRGLFNRYIIGKETTGPDGDKAPGLIDRSNQLDPYGFTPRQAEVLSWRCIMTNYTGGNKKQPKKLPDFILKIIFEERCWVCNCPIGYGVDCPQCDEYRLMGIEWTDGGKCQTCGGECHTMKDITYYCAGCDSFESVGEV